MCGHSVLPSLYAASLKGQAFPPEDKRSLPQGDIIPVAGDSKHTSGCFRYDDEHCEGDRAG